MEKDTCTICQETPHTPVRFNCIAAHTFCFSCICNLVKNAFDKSEAECLRHFAPPIPCPSCRGGTGNVFFLSPMPKETAGVFNILDYMEARKWAKKHTKKRKCKEWFENTSDLSVYSMIFYTTEHKKFKWAKLEQNPDERDEMLNSFKWPLFECDHGENNSENDTGENADDEDEAESDETDDEEEVVIEIGDEQARILVARAIQEAFRGQ